jgi:hypothetical protein
VGGGAVWAYVIIAEAAIITNVAAAIRILFM